LGEHNSSSHASCLHADSSSEITMQPQPTEKEIQFILDAIAEYLTVKARLNLLPSCLKFLTFENSLHGANRQQRLLAVLQHAPVCA